MILRVSHPLRIFAGYANVEVGDQVIVPSAYEYDTDGRTWPFWVLAIGPERDMTPRGVTEVATGLYGMVELEPIPQDCGGKRVALALEPVRVDWNSCFYHPFCELHSDCRGNPKERKSHGLPNDPERRVSNACYLKQRSERALRP